MKPRPSPAKTAPASSTSPPKTARPVLTGVITQLGYGRGAPEKPATDLRRPCGPSPGSAPPLLAHESTDALAPLLVASPGSGPPGSPNLSPRVFGRASRRGTRPAASCPCP